MKDLIVNLPNTPGMLAAVGEVLGNAGINIEGVSGTANEGAETGWVHILVADADMAKAALEAAGVDYGGEREVEVMSLVDQPGEMGRMLRKVAEGMEHRPDWLQLAIDVEDVALRVLAEKHPERALKTNVEYYAAPVLMGVGLTPDLFPATFSLARHAGWTAHSLEQAADNRLIRPDVNYVGPADFYAKAVGATIIEGSEPGINRGSLRGYIPKN